MNNTRLGNDYSRTVVAQKLIWQVMIRLALILVFAAGTHTAFSAAITWQTPTTVVGDTDVSTAGTLVYAYNFSGSSSTVNGVAFAANTSTSGAGGNLSFSPSFGFNYNGFGSGSNPYNALSSAYKVLLANADFLDGTGASVSITLNNLTVGHSYAVQYWVNDSRGSTRSESLTSSGGNTVTLAYDSTQSAGGVGQYSVGTFTANATTQSFTVTTTAGNNDVQLNAIQVRDLTPQPGSFQSLSPAPNAYSAPTNSVVSLNVVAGTTLLKTNTVTLTLDGFAVSPVVTGNSNALTISYQPPAGFTSGTFHTVLATVTDANNTLLSTNWSFWTQPPVVAAGGTWAALNNAPPFGVNMCMLLGDGSVLGMNGDGRCARLTPDSSGSYRNGTWTQLASMNNDRLFFASTLLTNGNVFVAGGEYGAGRRHAEWFDPLNNVWTKIPDPMPGPAFSDAIGKILPNGNVLVAPVSQFGGNVIYNPVSNNWQTAASTLNQNEACWVKLQNDNILTVDTDAQTSEHYVPSLNQWVADGNVPVAVYGYGAEIGAGFLLPNGNVFYIGGSTNTAIYTPGATSASAGSWAAGPPMVFGANQLGAVDAPAAMMTDGNVLCVLGPVGGFNNPCYFYEYNYVANTFTQIGAPGGGSTYDTAPFTTSLLCLPTGEVLFVGGQNSQSLYIYTPNGSPLAAGRPSIATITENTDGSYHLVGTNLNGISEGAAYGDDEQMDSNYPLIRMTNNASHVVYYARAYNRSSTSVMTGNQSLSTEFALPQGLPSGTYSLVAVANGNPSAPTSFTYSPPSVPTGLTAASGSNAFVKLNWGTSAGATAYNIKRASKLGGYYATIATVAGNSYTNSGLTNGLTYYYKVSAIGSGGPSGDSSSVSATPAGPTVLPGATSVNLISYYNRAGIYTDGQTFGGGGFDAGGHSFSANLLGDAVVWNNLVFGFGPMNALDVVFCAGQTITLPAGHFNTLQILAAAVNGDQQNQSFTVTYTDNSTAVFTQSVSDWTSTQSYQNENKVTKTLYRNTSTGGAEYWSVSVNAYVFPLDQTKTVKNILLPNNSNLNLMSAVLANDSVGVSLTGYYNRAGIYTDGTIFTNSTGVDGGGHAVSGTLVGNSQTWGGTIFPFGPMNATNVISCVNQTIPLPAGKYSRLQMLGMAVNGNQAAQTFVVTYTDATTTNITQGISDWFTPQNYAGEANVVPMGYRNSSDGSSSENQSLYLYGYSFPLNASKTIQSVRMPNNANVTIDAIALVPNWQPVFLANPFTLANASVGQGYSGTIATNATDPNSGDVLTFAKVSGPAWLSVASNGSVSGSPSNPDAGTNSFVVSVTDQAGLSNTATMSLVVTGASVYTLIYNSGANGSISGTTTQSVVYGNSGTAVTAVPNTGYAFLNWSDGSTANPRTDTNVTNNITVTANFTPLTYTLTYNAGIHGSISGTTPQTVNYGGSGTAVTAVSNTGYAFVNWSDGSTANPRTDTNVTSNITVTANFTPLTYTLTYTAGTNGSISGTTPQTVNYGGSGTAVTAVPNTGYAFTNWSDGSTANPRIDSNVTSNITVAANFVVTNSTALPVPWTTNAIGSITASTSATYSNGSFTVSGAGTNISGKNDNFWFVNQLATNDATIIARVASQGSSSASVRAGVMMRENLAAGSRSVFIGLVPTNQAQWVRRSTTNGNSSSTTVNGGAAPYWMKLTRSGNTFTGYISGDGSNWSQLASASISMAGNYTLGLAVCSGSGTTLNTSVFDNVSTTNVVVPVGVLPSGNFATLNLPNFQNGLFSFTITGDTNSVWQLEESSDFQTWNVLQSIGLIGGSVDQAEGDSGQQKRFLRLRSAP